MRINPPEAVAIAIQYRAWEFSQWTEVWERLGALLDRIAARRGGWDAVHQLCVDYLPGIPFRTLELAYADYKIRRSRSGIFN